VRRGFERSKPRWLFAWCGLVLAALARPASAEVPKAPSPRGREFRVDFSARHLDVDAELGELSLSGDVEVTVGRYRLGGQRVRLKRGPRGIGVEGGGDIAFCSCDEPPVTLGYRSVTIAPPSDVLIERAVLRVGKVPLMWLPYLWLRSPDRVGVLFPSVEWRGEDGLLIGSGLHVPFDSNQGRPAERALDLAAGGYVLGGARVDARLLTPASTTFVRWDHRDGTALTLTAHAATSDRSAAHWAYDVDASLGPRGRRSLSSVEAAARRFDHAQVGVATHGRAAFAFGVAADAERAAWLSDPLHMGPFALLSSGGSLGGATSYLLDLGLSSSLRAGEGRRDNAENRGLQRLSLETAVTPGPLLLRLGGFEQGELLSAPAQSVSQLRAGVGAQLSLPLVRRFDSLIHSIAPELLGRFERRAWDGAAENRVRASGGLVTALGTGPRGAAVRLRVAGGLAGELDRVEPMTEASLGMDSRLLGARVLGVAQPNARSGELAGRLRLGPRGGTSLTTYAEGRTDRSPALAPGEARGDLMPSFQEQGMYDRAGLTSGAEVNIALASVLSVGGGADVDALRGEMLAVRSFVRYRHACGCVALAAFASERRARGGLDAGVTLDLMP
jgi:hypothetical protein